MSLRNQYQEKQKYIDAKKGGLVNDIQTAYEASNEHEVSKVVQRNIILVGRTRTGKSIIKSLLFNPTTIPKDLQLFSHTETPTIDSYYVADKNVVLNIMDTPGLEERGNDAFDPRDNARIVKDIDLSTNREFIKLHVICFCIAVTSGINGVDVQVIQQFMNIFGESASKNSCLVITHCESKDDEERNRLETQLKKDTNLSEIIRYCKVGVFFSGALNPDDYNMANDTLRDQFSTITADRTQLIQMFTGEIEPISLEHLPIGELKRARDAAKLNETELFQVKRALDVRISAQLATENDLRTTTSDLRKLESGICKSEHTVAELQAQLERSLQDQEKLQITLSDEQARLQQIAEHLETQQQAHSKVVEQLEHEQQASSSTKRSLKRIKSHLERIENEYKAEIQHLREMQARLEKQLAGESKEQEYQIKSSEDVKPGSDKPQNPPKGKGGLVFFLLNRSTKQKD